LFTYGLLKGVKKRTGTLFNIQTHSAKWLRKCTWIFREFSAEAADGQMLKLQMKTRHISKYEAIIITTQAIHHSTLFNHDHAKRRQINQLN
jgi:hypothetical protein